MDKTYPQKGRLGGARCEETPASEVAGKVALISLSTPGVRTCSGSNFCLVSRHRA
jgi:hypothetical protein